MATNQQNLNSAIEAMDLAVTSLQTNSSTGHPEDIQKCIDEVYVCWEGLLLDLGAVRDADR
jgi:hypothetical protein